MNETTFDANSSKNPGRARRAFSFGGSLGALTGLVLLCVAVSFLSPHFLTTRNLLNILQQISIVSVIAVGMTFLLVSGNPLLRDVASPARYSRNLTFAQFFKSLGSISGPYLVAWVVGLGFTWKGVFPIFGLLALAAWAAVTLVRIPETPPERPARLKDSFRLLRERPVLWRILGIFLFAGSEMGMNNFLASHLWLTFGMGIQGDAIRYGQGLFWVSQGAGRLLGALALNWVSAPRFLLLNALGGLAGLGGLTFGSQWVVVGSVALCGLTFSNIWPTLFAITLETRPGRSAELAGLAVMANVGGAVVPLLMGVVTDATAVRWAFLVPFLAFLYLARLARGRVQGSAGMPR